FDRLAKGRATINVSDLRIGQEDVQAWAQKQGITNGQLTREQFVSYLQSPEGKQVRDRIMSHFRGGAGGGRHPGGQGTGPGTSSGQEGQPSNGRRADDPAESSKTSEKEVTNIITLKHAKASSLQKIFQELYGQKIRLASDERTNSLILVGAAEPLTEIIAVIQRLDGPEEKKAVSPGK